MGLEIDCYYCRGTGTMLIFVGLIPDMVPCNHCNGTGRQTSE